MPLGFTGFFGFGACSILVVIEELHDAARQMRMVYRY